jgi:hypothetical protein
VVRQISPTGAIRNVDFNVARGLASPLCQMTESPHLWRVGLLPRDQEERPPKAKGQSHHSDGLMEQSTEPKKIFLEH